MIVRCSRCGDEWTPGESGLDELCASCFKRIDTANQEELQKPWMQAATTSRGFSLYGFEDRHGEACSLQESSLADEPCVWLGCDEAKVHPRLGVPLSPRMHLTQSMAAELIEHLQHFIETGRLRHACDGRQSDNHCYTGQDSKLDAESGGLPPDYATARDEAENDDD